MKRSLLAPVILVLALLPMEALSQGRFDSDGYFIPRHEHTPQYVAPPSVRLDQRFDVDTEVRVDVPAPKVNINIEQPNHGLWGQGSWMKLASLDRSKSLECIKENICGYEYWGNTDSIKRLGVAAFINIKTTCLNQAKKRWFCAFAPGGLGAGRPYRFNCSKKAVWNQEASSWNRIFGVLENIYEVACS